MKRKFTRFTLLLAFTTLTSSLVAQQPSSHPLLDKYYPQPKQPTNNDKPKTTTVTSLTPTSNTQKPVTNTQVSNNKPAFQPNITDHGPAPDSTTIPASTITTINKPATIINTTPVQTPAKPYDPNSLYDTRLGSSSPQYNTYEKNSYGAGTVTTSPK